MEKPRLRWYSEPIQGMAFPHWHLKVPETQIEYFGPDIKHICALVMEAKVKAIVDENWPKYWD